MKAPTLRFSSKFKESTWKKASIKDVLSIGSGRDHKHLNEGNIPVFGSGGIMRYVDEYLYNGETVCIGRKGTINNPLYNDGKIWTVDTLFYTYDFKDVTPKFIYQLFSTINWLEYNEASGVPSLSKKTIEQITIYHPSLDEQNEISTCLFSVDKKITLQSRKVNLLQQYKKGLIESIFSQKIRFKDDNGANFSEWDECELSSVALKVNIKNKDESLSNVLTNSATQGIVSQTDYFDREIVTSSNLGGYYVVNIGDFVYNPRISSSAPVGPIKMNKHSLGVMSPLYTVFRFIKGNNLFYQYFFESTKWHVYMKSVSNSGARHDRMNITTSHFLSLPVPQPLEEEQQKIADFLSSIDDKITIENNKLDKLKQWKQGLLQQMFV